MKKILDSNLVQWQCNECHVDSAVSAVYISLIFTLKGGTEDGDCWFPAVWRMEISAGKRS